MSFLTKLADISLALVPAYKFQFKHKEHVGEDVYKFHFTSGNLRWKAGQHLLFSVPHTDEDSRGTKRMFTISSAPAEAEVAITTRIYDKPSSLKQTLMNLTPGAEIAGWGPLGRFTLRELDRDYVFIAGGIGITPVRSMLVQAAAENLKVRARIYHMVSGQFLPLAKDLQQVAADVIPYLNHEKVDPATLAGLNGSLEKPYFYVTGPKPFVEAYLEVLSEAKIPSSQVKIDKFYSPITGGYTSY